MINEPEKEFEPATLNELITAKPVCKKQLMKSKIGAKIIRTWLIKLGFASFDYINDIKRFHLSS